jgi:molybdate transport system ATP-binding protein
MSFDVDVGRSFGPRRARVRVSARFEAGGGVTVLFGPSGAGKTSVLNMIAGLLRPDRGHVRVNGISLFDRDAGIDLPPDRRRVGYVFQDGRLFPHRTVGANLRYGLKRTAPGDRWIGFDDVVAFLGIGHLLGRRPQSLSGGEAQRVAIGRALLAGPRTLLMDEPLSSLDPARREEIMTVIERIRDDLKIPILYVTHDAAEAERLATRRVEIGGGAPE